MADKNVQSAVRSLRARVPKKEAEVSIRVGGKRFELSLALQSLASERYCFVALPSVAGLYRIEGRELKEMEPTDDASEAFAELDAGMPKRPGRPKAIRELPDFLKEALKNIPEGYRIGYDPDGTPKLVRKRNRRKRKGDQESGS